MIQNSIKISSLQTPPEGRDAVDHLAPARCLYTLALWQKGAGGRGGAYKFAAPPQGEPGVWEWVAILQFLQVQGTPRIPQDLP